MIVVANLITEQVQGRRLLRKASKKLEQAKKMGKIATWEYDVETGFFQWEGYEHIQGFKSGDKLDFKQVMKLIDESYHPEIYQLQDNAIKHGLPFSIVHPFRVNDKKFWFHNHGKVEYTDQNKMKVVGLIQDITKQVNAERMYKNQNIELKKINHELDKFVYKTAHDLRAPLTNIAGLISIMRLEKDPRTLNTYFDLQLQSVQRLDNFIQKITNYTKNKRLPILHKQVDVRRVLDDILSSYYFVENFEKISKQVSFQSGAEFYTDEERLRIILTNAILHLY